MDISNGSEINLDTEVYNNVESGLSSTYVSDTISITNLGDINYDEEVETHTPKGVSDIEQPNGTTKKYNGTGEMEKLPRSIISPYFNTRIKSVQGVNYPRNDNDSKNNMDTFYRELTVQKLVENRRGASKFDYDDFLYLAKLDTVPLNRLITLRRFAYPVTDDIFKKSSQGEPDMCRLLTFSTQEENKLSEILSMSLGLKWRKLESTYEEMQMHGTSSYGISGVMGQLTKYFDPSYGQQALQGASIGINPTHDTNKVYGVVDSIASTHIRDVGVDFSQEIPLTFNFEMRSINGINQKTAFLDLLSNIILMCTNDAKFWGGGRYWVGVRPSKYMSSLKDILHPSSWQDFISKSQDGLQTFVKNNLSSSGSALNMLKNIANNALNMLLANVLNKFGRVGTPIMNSLLTGNPVGLWHLTVGNPLNPILASGDMLINSAKISFGDELGYDDFPTQIKVEITLMNAKPKGRAEIESMFNCGKGRIYFKPKDISKRRKVKSSKDLPIPVGDLQNRHTLDGFDDGDDTYDKYDVTKMSSELWSFIDPTETFNN